MGISSSITNYDNPKSFAAKLRAKRIAALVSMINSVYEQHKEVNIIDIGGTKRYWKILPEQFFKEKNISISIVNIPGANIPKDEGPFKFIEGDGCNLAKIKDKEFHISHSNSVLEHVGDWGRMKQFAAESDRVAENYYVQTPYYYFPMEPHSMTPFFHWLPKPWRIRLLLNFNVGMWKKQPNVDKAVSLVEGSRLVNRKMFKYLFPDAVHKTEHLFLFSKSLIAIKK